MILCCISRDEKRVDSCCGPSQTWWTRGELNPFLLHAMELYYRCTTGPGGPWENRTPASAMRMRRITTVLTAQGVQLYNLQVTISIEFFNDSLFHLLKLVACNLRIAIVGSSKGLEVLRFALLQNEDGLLLFFLLNRPNR